MNEQIFQSRLVLASPETATDGDYAAILGVVGHEVHTFLVMVIMLALFLVDSIILTACSFSSISTTGLGIGNCLLDITIMNILFICNYAIITCI